MDEKNISRELYRTMQCKGYPDRFCSLVSESLHTDFTADMMVKYLSHFDRPPSMQLVTDEMLAILSLRDGIVDKKVNEYYNRKWNEYLWLQKHELL